uniref:Uncharacterized protein n=1 Tax=Avena sativa TaxID=4498 RepID=A0ACD5Z044_AVESA
MEADLRELARLPDVLAVCSSTGWTDQRHVLYLGLLQESFVNQLHGGEIGFRGLFNPSPRASSTHKQSSKFMKKAEQVRPTSSEHRKEDGEVHSTDDDASSTETVQESSSSYQASATSSGQSSSSTSQFGNREISPSRTTTAGSYRRTRDACVSSEGSDQNFVDEDAEGSGESRRRRGNKRLKYADDAVDDQVRERRYP